MSRLEKSLIPAVAATAIWCLTPAYGQCAWRYSGNHIYYSEGYVGIGLWGPRANLHIDGGEERAVIVRGRLRFNSSAEQIP